MLHVSCCTLYRSHFRILVSMSHLEDGQDVLIIFDVGDAHANDARQRVHYNLVVQRMRLVLRAQRHQKGLTTYRTGSEMLTTQYLEAAQRAAVSRSIDAW